VWITSTLNQFEHRHGTLEVVVADINGRQLPEIRNDIKDLWQEMNEKYEEMNKKYDEIDQRLDKIELQLNTVITYLAIQSK
jgi:hypothetical protein